MPVTSSATLTRKPSATLLAAWAAGAAAILDSFPGALSGSWAQSIDDSSTGAPILTASGGQLVGQANSSSIYWTPAQYGPDCEVALTIAARPSTNGDNVHLGLRLSSPGVLGSMSGYQAYMIASSLGDQIVIRRRDNSVLTDLASVNLNWAAGDRFAFRAAGPTLTVYRSTDGGATWAAVVSAVDATYTSGGYVGVGGRDAAWRGDDFAASNTGGAQAVATMQQQQGSTGRLTTAAVTTAPTVARSVAAKRATSVTAAASSRRQANKPLTTTLSPVATSLRGKVYAIVLSTTQNAGQHLAAITLTATQAATATLTAVKLKLATVSATQGQAPTLRRQPGKLLQTGSMMPLPPVFSSIVGIATLGRLQIGGRILSATQGQAATVRRANARTLSATQGQAPTVRALIARALAAATSAVASITVFRGKQASTSQASDATTTKSTSTQLSATAVATPSVAKQSRNSLVTAAAGLASLLGQKVSQLKSATATAAATATVSRSVGRELDADPVDATAVTTKAFPRVIATTQEAVAASPARLIRQALSVGQAHAATLALRFSRTAIAFQDAAATIDMAVKRLRVLLATVQARASMLTDHPAIFRILRTGRIAASSAGHIASSVAGRIETFLERLD